MEPNIEVPKAAPIVPEVDRSKELINQKYAGLQAALLLDALRPGPGKTLEKQQLLDVKKQIDQNDLKTEKITNGSKYERDEYWNKDEYKNMSPEEKKSSWITSTDKFFESYSDNDEAKKVLEALDMNKGAESVYRKYFDEHKGDMGYFAMRVATELTEDQIRNNEDLLKKIGTFYGKDSSEVAKYLAEGIKNLKEKDMDIFANTAIEQFNKGEGMEGIEIVDGVLKRSGVWVEDQKKREKEKERQRIEAENKAKEQENKPDSKPEVQSEKEKEIRGAIESLVKLKLELNEEAKKHNVDIADKKQLEDAKNGWGKEVWDKYNETYKALRSKIDESERAGEVGYVSSKYEDLKPGDIIDGMKASPSEDILLIFDSKDTIDKDKPDEKGYKLHALGVDTGLVPLQMVSEVEARDHQVPKMVFVEKGQEQEKEKEDFRKEEPNAVKFAKEFKEGKVELEDALVYFKKLADLRRRNESYFENFLYYQILTETSSPKEEDKSKPYRAQEEVAKRVDLLVEQAKQKSGGDVKKEDEYRQKIINDVLKVLYYSNYDDYVNNGNKDNVEWLGIGKAEAEEVKKREEHDRMFG